MTDREKAIMMAYTGVCMLTGNKFRIFHEYVEDIMGRPIQTIEMGMGSVADEIKEKARPDFLKLCEEDQEPSVTPQPKIGKWKTVKHYGRDYYQCTYCSMERMDDHSRGWNYCPFCGAKMENEI